MKSIITVFTFIILLLALANQSIGQTAISTLENESGDPVLKSFDDGGFVLLGEFAPSAESVPIEGDGPRLMWYPGKAAFRVGLANFGNWDEENIGARSTAMGDGARASGDASTAMGNRAWASEFAATAMGHYARAHGQYSISMGFYTEAIGDHSTAMGRSTEATGDYSTAMGKETIAASENSLSVGTYNESNQEDDNTLFVVGNGFLEARSDALHLDDSGNLTIAGSLDQNSDLRLKTKIEPIGEATLDKLRSIEPVRYQFKNQQTHPEGTQIGLIAQQVQVHFPELVSENSSGYLSLSYSNLTTVLLKGIQEQQEQIEHLQEKADQVDALEERLSAIEQSNNSQIAGISWPVALLFAGMAAIGGLFWKRRSDSETSFNNNPFSS